TGLGITLAPGQVANLEQWVHVDGTDTSESSLLPSTLSGTSIADGQKKFTQLLVLAATKKTPVLSVVSTSRQKNQPKILRLTVRVNPAFLNLAQNQLLKEAGKDATKRKEVNAMFTSIRNDLKTTKLVAVVDSSVATAPKLTRLEIANTKTTTEKGCAYKRLDKNGVGIESSYSCDVNTFKSVDTITGALNLSTDPTVQVIAPSNPASLKTLLDQLFQQIMGGDTETSTTSTISST
ncbi:hypothetical protein KBB27_02710, partial [Patescibacteria group bacterium]|nr:hypothetical protein [Patescibacteria group bacterium]